MVVPRLERIWIWIGTITMLAFFIVLVALSVQAQLNPPSYGRTIDPTKVAQTPPFDKPGLRQIRPRQYEAYYVGQIFSWTPQSITIPAGSTVTFYMTSVDVVHGFSIPDQDINLEIMPGWVSSQTHTFTTPGDYLIACTQYCGIGHSSMFAHIVVK